MGEFIASVLQFFMNAIVGTGLPSVLVYALENNQIEALLDQLRPFSDTIFLPIASVLVCIYFMMELMDKVSSDNFNTDQFIKLLLKLVIEIAIINNATDLAEIIVNFGTKFTAAVGGSLGGSISIVIEELGFWESLLTFVMMIIPFLIALVAFVIGYFMIYSYQLEFAITSVLAPIGFADFLTGGTHSNGMKFFRKLLALSLQGGIMILILYAGAILQFSVVGDMSFSLKSEGIIEMIKSLFNSFFACIGIELAIVGTLGTAKSIAQSVIGTN